MAKRLIFFCCLFFVLLSSPAWAMDFVCFEGYQIEDEVLPDETESATDAPADSEAGGAEVATGSAIIYEIQGLTDLIQPMSNYPSYEDGMISNTYFDFARGFLPRVRPGENYVFARTGQYQYIMAVGDFDDSFVGTADVYILNLARSGYDYSYVYLPEEPFTLSVGSALVYSSVPGYPSLSGADRSSDLLLISALVILCLLGLWLARLVFSPLLGWR